MGGGHCKWNKLSSFYANTQTRTHKDTDTQVTCREIVGLLFHLTSFLLSLAPHSFLCTRNCKILPCPALPCSEGLAVCFLYISPKLKLLKSWQTLYALLFQFQFILEFLCTYYSYQPLAPPLSGSVWYYPYFLQTRRMLRTVRKSNGTRLMTAACRPLTRVS